MRFLRRVFAIAAKEIVQLSRDRLTVGMVVGIPALQLLLFGYAINTDVRHLRAAVADQGDTRIGGILRLAPLAQDDTMRTASRQPWTELMR